MHLEDRIKKLVSYYVKKFNTRNPFEIADYLGILYQMGNIGCEGCYMFLKNHRYIFLNHHLPEHEISLVMAHELGHAILHKKQNCYFIRNKTLLLNSKTEIEANKFAIELLIPDKDLLEYKELNTKQLSRLFGYSEQLIQLKLKQTKGGIIDGVI
ncbi:MAG: ImmA/IrrE family metallo-endopeptidase [Lachnospiraceae bacterium]